MMLSIEQRQEFLLGLDLQHNTRYRVWAGSPIVQSNGSHPKIHQMPPQKAILIPGLEETAIAWEIRIIKSLELTPLIRADVPWSISLDGGVTQHLCRVLPPIREHDNPELAWVVILRR